MSEILWTRRELFVTPGEHAGGRTHLQSPTVLPLASGLWRVYFAARAQRNVASIFAVDVDPADAMRVARVHREAVLSPGERGAFDHFGLGPSCAFADETGLVTLYYTGVGLRGDVPYELAIGRATSEDGLHFERAVAGPVFAKGPYDPYFVSSPALNRRPGGLDMWYVGARNWIESGERLEPEYDLRRTRSDDGISWESATKPGLSASDFGGTAIGRPCIAHDGLSERLWFSVRGRDFRGSGSQAYRIWSVPLDARGDAGASAARPVRFANPPAPEDWDFDMQSYACVARFGDDLIMLYNGNTFGRDGIGWALGRLG